MVYKKGRHFLQIAGILFDKDGTLFDFQASWGPWGLNLINELANHDPGVAADLADRIGYDLTSSTFHADSLSVAGTVSDQAAALTPALPHMSEVSLIEYLTVAATRATMAPAVPLAPLLDDLRVREMTLGVATNDAEQAAHRHIANAGIADRFDFVAGYDSGYGAKPDPGMCRAFADAHDLAPDTVVMVGDSTHDLQAGRAAGMQVVAVLTGTATHDDLAPFADAVLPDIGHLPAWLDR